MTVEKQLYFDAYHNLLEVKALENAVISNGIPANALHIYADESLIDDKDWLVRLSGVKEAENLIGYKRIDAEKPIIVGIDECHEEKVPVIKFAMDQLLKEKEHEEGNSNDFNPLTDSHPVVTLSNGKVVSKYADLTDEEVKQLLDDDVKDHGDFKENEEYLKEFRDNHHDTELEEAQLSDFEEDMRQADNTVPPEDYGVNQDNFTEDK